MHSMTLADIFEPPGVHAPAEDPAREEDLVAEAVAAVTDCNWTVGRCAAAWTARYARGRTDADFAALVGLSGDQAYQRRRVWETFADVRAAYDGLRWSHFYAALNWDDAAECLGWADEMGATVAEMKAWRRASRGEDLAAPGEPETSPLEETIAPAPVVITAGPAAPLEPFRDLGEPEADESETADEPPVAAAARSVGGDDYAPFGQDARGDAPAKPADAGAGAAIASAAATLERLDKRLAPEVIEATHTVTEAVKDRLRDALGRVSAKVAEL